MTMKGLAGAGLRYRIMAWVTGVVLAAAFIWLVVLLAIWVSQGNSFGSYFSSDTKPEAYGLLWVLHGWLYFIYLITAVDLAFRIRYSLGKTVLILLAGTIPFMSFVAERYVHRDVAAALSQDPTR